MSQQQLSVQANISRSHLSAIEAPGLVHGMSLDAFFNIADSLEVDPAELINVSLFLDHLLKPNLEFSRDSITGTGGPNARVRVLPCRTHTKPSHA